MSRLKRLIVEAHQRSLWQALVVYLGASYAVLEAVQLFRDEFGLPDWLLPVALVLLLIGLPVVVVTSLAREEVYGDEVPEEHAEAAAEEDRRLRILTWRTAGLSFMAAAALWGVVAAGLLLFGGSGPASADERKSVAVLPFDNLSGDPENEYFSDGITGDIINHLSKIADLKVISRTSVMQYKGTGKNLREIGRELNVATVLEGEVQRIGDRVRINAQLVDAETDRHIWAEQYNRELADIFEIQSDVAQQVAAALEATLTPVERVQIERRLTENQEAYDYYLRGTFYDTRSQLEQDYRAALQMFQRAVELDPDFAEAWAWLSTDHGNMYWFYYDRTEERLGLAKQAVDAALRISPGLPEAHAALGAYYYYSQLDYDRALEEFEIARSGRPNGADIIASIGYVRRRQGGFDEALQSLQKAVELDPRRAEFSHNLGQTYLLVRDYRQAIRFFDRALTLNPEWPRPYVYKALGCVGLYGTTDEALAVLEQASRVVDVRDDPYFVHALVLLRALDGRFQDAAAYLDSLAETILETQYFLEPRALLRAQLYSWMGHTELARANYDTARAILERKVGEIPDDHRAHSSLGVAYAGLARKEEAVREGRLAVELMPVSKEALKGTWVVEDLARIYAMVGEDDAAIDRLEYLLSVPGDYSSSLLRVDPTWDPLRDHPRFQALLEKYER
jgi:TolB-like protein/Tfp pilus assembly protein PilF